MTIFKAAAHLLPLLYGLGFPAILTWGEQRGYSRLKKSAWILSAVLAGVLLLVLGGLFSSGEWVLRSLAVISFSLMVGIFCLGVYSFLGSLRCPAAVAQIGSGLLMTILFVAIFALGALMEDAHEKGLPGEVIMARIDWTIALCPYTVISYSILEEDVLRKPLLYGTDAADYPFSHPDWKRTGFVYFSIGLFFLFLSFGLNQFWKRRKVELSKDER